MRVLPVILAAISAVISLTGCDSQSESMPTEDFECIPSSASGGDFEVRGSVLVNDSEPLAGAMVTVIQDVVEVIACTGDDGRWSARLPVSAPLLVAIDPRSIPEGLELAGGANLATNFEAGLLDERVINLFLVPAED